MTEEQKLAAACDWLENEVAKKMLRIAELEAALRQIALPTYGTELHDTDAERADTFWGHINRFQSIARTALPDWAQK